MKIEEILPAINDILNGNGKEGKCPKFWDGDAAKRIVEHLKELVRSEWNTNISINKK